MSTTDGIEVTTTRDTTSATGIVSGPADEIFEFIRRPSNHPAISGDGTVKSASSGDEVLQDGSRFGMSMRWGAPYKIGLQVVEFAENRRIAWCHFSGHRWRWELEPVDSTHTRVTETFDMSTAKVPLVLRLMGFPKKHEDNVRSSVANLAAQFAGG